MKAFATSHKNRIEATYKLVRKQVADEEALSHWARYLCVITSGFVEVYVRLLLTDYARRKSDKHVANFVQTRLEGQTNLNEEKLYQLLVAFNPSWGDTFRAKRSDEQKAALDSVIANRNAIAHGKSVGITIAQMNDYYKEIQGIISIVERQCVT